MNDTGYALQPKSTMAHSIDTDSMVALSLFWQLHFQPQNPNSFDPILNELCPITQHGGWL